MEIYMTKRFYYVTVTFAAGTSFLFAYLVSYKKPFLLYPLMILFTSAFFSALNIYDLSGLVLSETVYKILFSFSPFLLISYAFLILISDLTNSPVKHNI